jgi:DNA-binding NarL/FixJ family response regulator
MSRLEPGQDSAPAPQEEEPEEIGKFELKTQFVELRAKGYSFGKIAKKLRVSKTTVSEWNEELSEQVARLRAQELEAIQEKEILCLCLRIQCPRQHKLAQWPPSLGSLIPP